MSGLRIYDHSQIELPKGRYREFDGTVFDRDGNAEPFASDDVIRFKVATAESGGDLLLDIDSVSSLSGGSTIDASGYEAGTYVLKVFALDTSGLAAGNHYFEVVLVDNSNSDQPITLAKGRCLISGSMGGDVGVN